MANLAGSRITTSSRKTMIIGNNAKKASIGTPSKPDGKLCLILNKYSLNNRYKRLILLFYFIKINSKFYQIN